MQTLISSKLLEESLSLASLLTGKAQDRQNTSKTFQIILPQNPADKEINVHTPLKYWKAIYSSIFYLRLLNILGTLWRQQDGARVV